jgi:hypothetical protein
MTIATRSLAPVWIAGLVLFSASALAGQVKGKITGHDKLVPDVYAEAAKPESHRYTWREPSPTVKQEHRVLGAHPSREICIAAFSTGGNAPAHEPILVKITGGRTIPVTLVVSPQTRLSFKNVDPFPHRLFQVGNPGWGANNIASNGQREWTATTQGRFEFRDELFPSVRAYVVVEPNATEFVYPAKDGSFVMDKLPPGEYVLKAFFGGKQVGKEISGVHIDEKKPLFEMKDPINVAEGIAK